MKVRALVADDSSTMRKIVLRSLHECGIDDITEVGNGDDAIQRFGEGEYDLVVTDWNMKGKSGLDLIQSIRGSGNDVPIIMVTTESEKSRVLAAIQAGVSDYLVKPFTAEVLREKIEKHLAV